MKKFICTVCGYIYEGDDSLLRNARCVKLRQPSSKKWKKLQKVVLFQFADEHVIGVAKGCDDEMIKDLNNHFIGDMYRSWYVPGYEPSG